ncbi:I78 family peptidase inhibitor [Ostreiculturibacter nitratireducens]|uniref:I78 family peptidase inhibitor n=1 Tax=Ostreiculturibacter nitratireducens TaxID=3075226 RepID=UPI0031B5A618
MWVRLFSICAVVSALSACVEEPVPVAPRVCEAGDLQYLVGRPEWALEGMVFAGPVRLIRPGTAITMDYRQERLNIEIGRTGRIIQVYCG